jgi:hypothetical protein
VLDYRGLDGLADKVQELRDAGVDVRILSHRDLLGGVPVEWVTVEVRMPAVVALPVEAGGDVVVVLEEAVRQLFARLGAGVTTRRVEPRRVGKPGRKAAKPAVAARPSDNGAAERAAHLARMRIATNFILACPECGGQTWAGPKPIPRTCPRCNLQVDPATMVSPA